MNVHSIISNSQRVETLAIFKYPLTDEWVNKILCIYTRVLFGNKRKTSTVRTMWMNLEDIMLSEKLVTKGPIIV